MTERVRQALAEREAQIVSDLCDFIRIPSISTDPAHTADIAAGAAFVAGQMSDAGLEHVQTLPGPGHPVVYGDWLHRPGAPTVLVYGHYDVQPPDPLEAWHSPPFDPTIRDDRLYGRGVSDDKGPMLIPLKVAQAFRDIEGGLPINLKLLIEGEEEVGSRNLEAVVQAHRVLLEADFVMSADGAQWRPDLASVNVGSRGVVTLEITVQTAAKDLHSGRHGGTVANATHVLAQLVAGLHDRSGRVAVAGFYDDVPEPDAQARADIAEIPFDEGAYLAELGAHAPAGEVGYPPLERQWLRPTLDVCGLWGGYQGPGSKTVIPHVAHAKLSCRLVPNQEPARTRELVEAHLTEHCPASARVTMHHDNFGMTAASVRVDHPGLRLAEAVLGELTGQTPLRVRMGGSIPIGAIFQDALGIETIYFSFSTGDEDFHAPNEFFRLSSLRRGLDAWARYWQRLGDGAFADR